MKYRELDANGDYVFGPAHRFLKDDAGTVAQAVKTRLLLFTGEWFLDLREGLDKSLILGHGTQTTRDQEVQERILGTPGVTELVTYESSVDADRRFTVTATLNTIYGPVPINQTL